MPSASDAAPPSASLRRTTRTLLPSFASLIALASFSVLNAFATISRRSAGAAASASGTSGRGHGDDEQLEPVARDPRPPVAHDAEHHDDLHEEGQPHDPVPGDLDRVPQPVRMRQRQREQRQDRERGDDDRRPKARLPCGGAGIGIRRGGHERTRYAQGRGER